MKFFTSALFAATALASLIPAQERKATQEEQRPGPAVESRTATRMTRMAGGRIRIADGVFEYEGTVEGVAGRFSSKPPHPGARPAGVLPGSTIVLYRVVPADAHLAKAPKASEALDEIDRQLQAARTANDREAVLRALEEIEKAVMRARVELHRADQESLKPKKTRNEDR